MKPLIWAPQAIPDVESLRAFIARTRHPMPILKPGAASALSNVFGCSPSLAAKSPDDRTLLFAQSSCRPYRIVYRLRGGVAEIVTVFRASRQFPQPVQ